MKGLEKLKKHLCDTGVIFRENVPGAELTTFRVGGPVSIVACPCSITAACEVLKYAEENDIPSFVIGNGSNLIISDEGADMLFIKLSGDLSSCGMDGCRLICGAGASLASAARLSVMNGFTGFEWAAGIPGTIGGAVAMNAGAYGGEIKQVIKRVTVYSDGSVHDIIPTENDLGYRISAFAYPDMTVLEAEFMLAPDDGYAKERMEELAKRRRDKQPLNYPSAGSVFKRPEGHFAGALIEQAGLKGLSVGGACVSEKHAGFIVNMGGASSADILALIELVREKVFERFGVMLEPEVKIIN